MFAATVVSAFAALGGLQPLPTRAVDPVQAEPPARLNSGLVLAEIATLPRAAQWFAVAEDAPQHRPLIAILNEFNSPPFGRTLFLSRRPGDAYVVEDSLAPLAPAALGDFDGDGLLDLMGQFGPVLRVYEATTPEGFPKRLAWESPPMTNVEGAPTACDSDRDGNMEFVYSVNLLSGPSHLLIYEAAGNDNYIEVYSGPPGPDAMGKKCVADIDGDGWPEIVQSGLIGRTEVYEATANNKWELTWITQTGLENAYAVDGGHDLDENGRPEFFVTGNTFINWPTIVFEATGDNTYAEWDRFSYPQSAGSLQGTGITELDGSSPEEFLVNVGDRIEIWQYSPAGTWHVIGEIPNADYAHFVKFGVADMNKNGRTEVIWPGFPTTAILEAPAPTDALGPAPAPGIHITPNPCRGLCTVASRTALPTGSAVRVYDVAGRVLATWRPAANTLQFPLTLDGLRTGTYFVDIRDRSGHKLGSSRAVVLR